MIANKLGINKEKSLSPWYFNKIEFTIIEHMIYLPSILIRASLLIFSLSIMFIINNYLFYLYSNNVFLYDTLTLHNIHLHAKLIMPFLGIIRIVPKNFPKNINKIPKFTISNHLSFLDGLIFFSFLNTRLIGKKAIQNYFFINSAFQTSRSIYVDRTSFSNRKEVSLKLNKELDEFETNLEKIRKLKSKKIESNFKETVPYKQRIHLFAEGCSSGFDFNSKDFKRPFLLSLCNGLFQKKREIGIIKISYHLKSNYYKRNNNKDKRNKIEDEKRFFCWNPNSLNSILFFMKSFTVVEIEYLGKISPNDFENFLSNKKNYNENSFERKIELQSVKNIFYNKIENYKEKEEKRIWKNYVYDEMVKRGNFKRTNKNRFDMIILKEAVFNKENENLFSDYIIFDYLKKIFKNVNVKMILKLVKIYKKKIENKFSNSENKIRLNLEKFSLVLKNEFFFILNRSKRFLNHYLNENNKILNNNKYDELCSMEIKYKLNKILHFKEFKNYYLRNINKKTFLKVYFIKKENIESENDQMKLKEFQEEFYIGLLDYILLYLIIYFNFIEGVIYDGKVIGKRLSKNFVVEIFEFLYT